MIAANSPVLAPLVPLAGALLIPVLAWGRPRAAAALAVLASAATAGVCGIMFARVVEAGPLDYHAGGWPPPWGIQVYVDAPGAFVATVVSAVACLALIGGIEAARREIGTRTPAFHSMSLLLLTGLMGMIVTGDAFNLFVFLEVASLSSYALVAAAPRRGRLAAFRYVVLGTIGASLYLLGVGFLYVGTGTLNMQDLHARVTGTPLGPYALALITAGLGTKMGLFPLHAWLPGAYGEAPTAAAAYMAPVATKAMAFALIRMWTSVFGLEFTRHAVPAAAILTIAGCVAVVVGAAVAAAQTEYRRLLAWSSIGQIGYLAIGLGLGTPAAVAAALFHVLAHALMKGALFQVAAATGARAVEDLRGLSRRMPATAAVLFLSGIAMAGAPPLVGFFSKWYLLRAAVDQGAFGAAGAILLGSLLAAVYVFRLIETAFLQAHEGEPREPIGWSFASMAVLTTAILAVGPAGRWLVEDVLIPGLR
jgi:multicomponent Na+:H+ antiporter subunit D